MINIKEKRGDVAGISVLMALMLIFIVMGLIMYLMPIFDKQLRLQTFAKQLVRECEISGTIDQDDYIQRLKKTTGLDPDISFEYAGYKGTKKVQLNGMIKVILKDKYKLKLKAFINTEIPLKAVGEGRSEVYYK